MNAYAISALINCIIFSSLGIFVYLRGREKIINKKYLIFCTAVGFWSYGYFLWQIANDSVTALFYCRCFMAGSIFITITFLDFVLALLDQRQYKKKILYMGYLIFSLFWFLNFTSLFVKGVSPKLSFKYWPEPGAVYHLFLLLWLFYCLYALYLLFIGYRKSSGIKRNQIKYVLVGSAIGYLTGCTNYFLWYDIFIPPYGNFFIPFYPFIISYAILRHRLLDINIVFRKTLIYSFIIGSLFTISVVILFILVQFFGGFFPQKTVWLTLFLVIVLSLLFQPVYRRGTTLIDRIFFKGTLPRIAEELQRSEKLASLGVLASGLAHEIKNPLAPIKTYIQNLRNNINNPAYLDKITKIIPGEVDKITDIINQLRDFANPPPLSTARIDVHNIIDKRISLLEEELTSKGITVERKYSPILPEINADPIQLERVFINLFLNAIDAMHNGGILTITTGQSDGQLMIKVSDTGTGIAGDDLPHIFDPFYSKGKHKGTGLGLAITHRIISEHNGNIQVESLLGRGTSFCVYLPIEG